MIIQEPFLEQEFEGVVAMIDVLGFGHRFKGMNNKEVRDKVIAPLIHSALTADILFNHDTRTMPIKERLNWFYFADTVVLLLPKQDGNIYSKESECIHSMAYVCSIMLGLSVWHGIALRGAISYGECLVCENPLYYLGEPFIEAHSFETKQCWSGVSLCPTAELYINENDLRRLVRYNVPIKIKGKEKGFVDALAVNWPGNCIVSGQEITEIDIDTNTTTKRINPSPDWDACFSSKNPDVIEKRKNTISFFNKMNSIYAGNHFGPDMVEQTKHWQYLYRKRFEL